MQLKLRVAWLGVVVVGKVKNDSILLYSTDRLFDSKFVDQGASVFKSFEIEYAESRAFDNSFNVRDVNDFTGRVIVIVELGSLTVV